MAWQTLAENSLSGGAASTLDSGTFESKKYLLGLIFAPEAKVYLRVNDTAAASYTYRRQEEGGSDSTYVNMSEIKLDRNSTESSFIYFYIYNVSDQEKLFVLQHSSDNDSGASTAPKRQELVIKWDVTSEPITEINLFASAGDLAQYTQVAVLGTD